MTIEVEEWDVAAAGKLQPQFQKEKQRVEQAKGSLVRGKVTYLLIRPIIQGQVLSQRAGSVTLSQSSSLSATCTFYVSANNMLEVTHSRSEVTSIWWRLSWSNKGRNKHMTKGQSGTNTFWKLALFCTRVKWKALSSLTKNVPGRKNCSKKLGPAPKERERND